MGHVGLDTNKIVYMYDRTVHHHAARNAANEPGKQVRFNSWGLERALHFRPSKLLEMTCLELIQTG